jgi:hypothetical protein
MDRAEFTLKVTRPWARDPGFYLEPLQRLAFTPLPNASLAGRVRAIPAQLAAARFTLDAMAADHVDLAIRSLDQSDGVEDGFPQRGVPPAGVIGWYRDLRARAVREQPELVPDIDRAIAALTDYRNWLKSARAGVTARAGVGKARLDWYLRHALKCPMTAMPRAHWGSVSWSACGRSWPLPNTRTRRCRRSPWRATTPIIASAWPIPMPASANSW